MSSTRREFLATCVGTGLWAGGLLWSQAAPSTKTYRAAVIGRTGGGEYGHGYERIFHEVPNVELVAIADHDAEGLKKAAERSGAKRQYLNYREMLEKEKPDLVSIAPRHPDCHKEMALAAINIGASIFMEKPMTEVLVEADDILAAAEKRGTKICLAHNRRWTSGFVQIKGLLEQGLIGQVREVRIQGKQDQRAGGEDLIVLGTHDLDLMRYYFGDPLWCSASVMTGGRDYAPEHARRGGEPMTVAGDTIRAQFAFPNNLGVSWSSVRTSDHWNTNFSKREKWAFEIYGTKGIIAYQSGLEFLWLDSPYLAHTETPRWQELPAPKNWEVPLHARHPVRSLIHAIETKTQPVCSGFDGRWAIEMVSAIYLSAKNKARVSFPLTERGHPLRSA